MTPRRPRLLIVVNADWFFVSHRLRLAKAARDAGFEVHVAAGASEAAETIRAAGFPFHPVFFDRGGTNPVRDSRTLFALARLYRRLRPDLVHHVTVKPVVYGGAIARLLGIPALHAITGMGHVFIREETAPLRARALRRFMLAAWKNSLHARRAWSMFQNDADRRYYVEEGVALAERSFLVPGSGVDTQHFSASPIPEGPPVVLLPARLLWTKGLGEFVEASRIVRAAIPEARFVLAGRFDPENPGAIPEDTVRGWTEEGVVEWWGSRSQREMAEAYREAALVVLPSYREGLPLAVVEAQASGRAVITTDVEGCRDAILVGESGWLVPVRDGPALGRAILEALTNRPELERRARRAREFAVERFREEAIFGAILAAYRTVLAEGPGA